MNNRGSPDIRVNSALEKDFQEDKSKNDQEKSNRLIEVHSWRQGHTNLVRENFDEKLGANAVETVHRTVEALDLVAAQHSPSLSGPIPNLFPLCRSSPYSNPPRTSGRTPRSAL